MGKLTIINPYNKNHIELIKDFEKEYQLDSSISNSLIEMSLSQPEKAYQAAKRQDNAIEEYIVLEENLQVKGLCLFYGEKDRKVGLITFPSISKSKIKQTILLATNYAIEHIGMLEVLIDVDKDAKDIQTYLEKHDFENLGEESSKIIYLKEKESKKTGEGSYHESIR